jgi:aspartyl aminopeptidase
MHSIREMCGSADVASCVQLFATFFSEFATIDALITHAD